VRPVRPGLAGGGRRCEHGAGPGTGRIEPVHLGSTLTAGTFVPVARPGPPEPVDAGDNAAFPWSLDTETYPKTQFTIRFADDQEIDWEVGPDLF
jgi:hypothetical protein